eukprot:TRINITY_DN15658_c0_g1_i1.p1 TRINITY_DN15658_c0_g1~~TRINITY_DN15658_c0_g1_i1.p1  ORF type:complete len:148 (+),score=7.47 TRINITY_DN15658_c0_g1_i1:28-444(+)
MKFVCLSLCIALFSVASGIRLSVPIPPPRTTINLVKPTSHSGPSSPTTETTNHGTSTSESHKRTVSQHVITGSHYQVGLQLGRLIAPTLPSYLEQTNFTSGLGTWLGKSPENKQLFAWWNELGQTKYPKVCMVVYISP